jgi:hypothetical protein
VGRVQERGIRTKMSLLPGPIVLELGESTALFSLSSDAGGGEGRGEDSRFYWISPPRPTLPPLVPRREGATDAGRSNA